MNKSTARLIFFLVGVLVLPVLAHAKLSSMDKLQVAVLYDNSGSMYPGYRLDGSSRRSETGAKYFYQYPQFRQFLAKLLRAHTRLNCDKAAVFEFTNRSIKPLTKYTSPTAINLEKAFRSLPSVGGRTYLTESLDSFTQNYEGLVWMVTDNIVNNRPGAPDLQDVINFFQSMNDTAHIRAVHLFKLPFKDDAAGVSSNLALYAFLVSPEPLSANAARNFDRKIASLASLFPGKEHLKLKDLSLDPISLSAQPLEINISEKKGSSQENQRITMRIKGNVHSNLTQHYVTSGVCRIRILGFSPDDKGRKDFGLKNIPSSAFPEVTFRLNEKIPPGGNWPFEKVLHSKDDISLDIKGVGAWLRAAWGGVKVDYKGQASISFTDVKVLLERAKLAGIYGIDQASTVFDFQDIKKLKVQPAEDLALQLVVRTGAQRSLVLLPLLLLLAALLGLAVWLGLAKVKYQVTAQNKLQVIGLRRFGSSLINHNGKMLGRLSRSWGEDYAFRPNMQTDLRVIPTKDNGVWYVDSRGEQPYRLVIALAAATQRATPNAGTMRTPSRGDGPAVTEQAPAPIQGAAKPRTKRTVRVPKKK